ncbi:MAG: hypothetical protein IPJ19_12125 [Planctomycetes bacterium]|nr:hypothetical protein [Planctomycetota bacterium]
MRILQSQAALLLSGVALALVGLSLPPSASPAPQTQGGSTLTTADLDAIAQRLLQTRSPSGLATADSNRNMIAVTGIDMTGSSVLYLVDTEKKQLAVYQANGGGEPTQSLRLVGARRIDLDLQIEGFNDKSQYNYEELQKRFDKLGKAPTK